MKNQHDGRQYVSQSTETVHGLPIGTWTSGSSQSQKNTAPVEPSQSPTRHQTSHTGKDRSDVKSKLSEEKIFQETVNNEKVTIGATVFTDLPRYDDAARYGLDNDGQRDVLVHIEIRRLIKAVTTEEPVLFNDLGVLGGLTKESIRELSHLADQLLCNFAILRLDNIILTLDNCSNESILKMCAKEYKTVSELLRKRFTKQGKAKPTEPVILKPESQNREGYFALVDYITAAVVCHLVDCGLPEGQTTRVMATLSAWSVKLKTLYYNSAVNAQECLDNAEDAVQQLIQREDRKSVLVMRNSDGQEAKEVHIEFDDHEDPTRIYYLRSYIRRYNLKPIFHAAAMCTVAYETGLERSLVALHEDRDGDVWVSPENAAVGSCYFALDTVITNLEHMKRQSDQRSRPPRKQDLEIQNPIEKRADIEVVTIDWRRTKGNSVKSDTLETSNAAELISIMVPLSLSNPRIADDVESLMQEGGLYDDTEDWELPKLVKVNKFQARCTLATSTWLAKQLRVKDPKSQLGCIPLSRSPLHKRIRAGTTLDGDWIERSKKIVADELQSDEVLQEYKKEASKMDSWVFHANAIELRCRGYVLTVMLICFVLIAGALAIPFTVGTRIAGVDPFQITAFSWLLAGVIIIASKSRYVSEWPWHDFIHGTVICDSVTDLADVTGVSEQMILTKLLHSENGSMVSTRGPYNGMFSNRSDSAEGFSIDVPVKLSTMLASGFIVLKVLGDSGEHLLILDARKGSSMDWANKSTHSASYLCCLDIESNEDYHDEGKDLAVSTHSRPLANDIHFVKKQNVSWSRLVGLYIADSWFG
ncbi:hypothetical protein EPUS_05689 [Endocarpon pusillum Z07020]|uniref:Uncharacterized protein n=1 Tax=Endocarpon pusillum (strain Z07020 / HMAS-L-300199) TaxID=1263415 RepID=U1HQF5_ENDPU|nr:uncharacterized protein EPUS_05689 [Endocarpon pusillum Z07020]ERF72635.1 hypothetical protein EPUS_05689 [Endocarpon pusillum Z07020]